MLADGSPCSPHAETSSVGRSFQQWPADEGIHRISKPQAMFRTEHVACPIPSACLQHANCPPSLRRRESLGTAGGALGGNALDQFIGDDAA